jgi:hypothetical protein
MYYDHLSPTSPALFRPVGPNVAPVAQTHLRSPSERCEQCAGTFQVPVPGGASILMKDAAGTSMSLNVDIDPSSGTPILSGQAINAQGDVLDVHPCSCNDPIASRHNLVMPRSPVTALCPHVRDPSRIYPSPLSPRGAHRRPTPIFTRNRTPLVLVQTRLPESPSTARLQLKPQAPAPGSVADALESPFTPTPASIRHFTQSSSGDDSFHTAQTCLDVSSTTPASATPHPLESPRVRPRSPLDEPPRLVTPPVMSAFDPNFDSPLVESPSSMDLPYSEISGPSAIGPLPSLPSPSSYAPSENSIRTITPGAHLVEDDDDDGLIVEAVTLPGLLEGSLLLANDGAEEPCAQDVVRTAGIATVDSLDIDLANIPRRDTGSTSDLYTNRAVVDPSMPTAKVGPDGPELRFDLTGQLRSAPMTVCSLLPSLSFNSHRSLFY